MQKDFSFIPQCIFGAGLPGSLWADWENSIYRGPELGRLRSSQAFDGRILRALNRDLMSCPGEIRPGTTSCGVCGRPIGWPRHLWRTAPFSDPSQVPDEVRSQCCKVGRGSPCGDRLRRERGEVLPSGCSRANRHDDSSVGEGLRSLCSP